MSNPLIRCSDLYKRYGGNDVLWGVDFAIEPGRLVGFLGPNGAGKTTTIRILLGLLKPSTGKCTIFGKSCQTQGKAIRQEVGYLPGDVHLYTNLTGRQVLDFMARARHRNCRDEIERLSGVLQLELDKVVRKYSTGMRQKLGLIQSLMHKPQLLILDEPTSALDPLVRKTVFSELKEVIREGRTVLFSSHSLSEVEELCDEVIIIRAGKIVEQQKVEDLRNKSFRLVTIHFPSAAVTPAEFPTQFELSTRNGNTIVGAWTGESSDLVRWLAQQDVDDVMIERPDLNDLFLTYYQATSAQ